jgi:hypothetical protein
MCRSETTTWRIAATQKTLIELTGNTLDPKYRDAWIDSADVDNAAEGANQSRYRSDCR